MMEGRNPGDPLHGCYAEYPCRACDQTIRTTDPTARLCPDCWAELRAWYESRAGLDAMLEPQWETRYVNVGSKERPKWKAMREMMDGSWLEVEYG